MKKLVYMNTLKKETEEKNISFSQVCLFELVSSWQMNWKVFSKNGEISKDFWVEKERWEEILFQLRLELEHNKQEGFQPLFIDYFTPSNALSPKSKRNQVLYFYSEQQANSELFEDLRKWRKAESNKEDKPPYIIATNRVLKMLSTFIPKTVDELLQIPGFATAKAEKYGVSILQVTSDYERLTSFPLHWVEKQISMQNFDEWLYKNEVIKHEKLKIRA